MVELTRRNVLAVSAVLLGGVTLGVNPALAEPAPTIDTLARRHNARVGLLAADLDSGRTVEYQADDMFAMCSTFKTYAAACVLQRRDRGELSLDQQVFVDPAEVVANSPVTEPRAGQPMTLAELCAAADDPKAENLRPLIGEVTPHVVSTLT